MTDHAPLPRILLEPAIRAALAEDLGRAGDVTSNAVLPAETRMSVVLRARRKGVAAGLDCATLAFELIDPEIKTTQELPDGARVAPGDVLMRIEGSARSILSAERVALNFAGRLSGVATQTRQMVDAVAHTNARIADTRKTTPGLRMLEKRAVALGGGSNHRFGLDDAILIKDNHIAAAGGVAIALQRAKAAAGHLLAIEIEVDTLEQFDEVLAEGGANAVLLDNMPPETMAEAVRRRDASGQRASLEASGNVTLETVAAIAESGVDYISSGALTHSVSTLDLGLDVD